MRAREVVRDEKPFFTHLHFGVGNPVRVFG
jgi:hypothetical protein